METTLYVSDNTIMTAIHKDNKLVRVVGCNAKVEQVEMNMVKIIKDGFVLFLELGANVRWMN